MAGRMKWMRALVLTGAFAALSGMTAFAANMKAGIDSLTINAENPKKLNIKMHCNQDSSGTDGKIYIFEIKPYQSKEVATPSEEPATEQPAKSTPTKKKSLGRKR